MTIQLLVYDILEFARKEGWNDIINSVLPIEGSKALQNILKVTIYKKRKILDYRLNTQTCSGSKSNLILIVNHASRPIQIIL